MTQYSLQDLAQVMLYLGDGSEPLALTNLVLPTSPWNDALGLVGLADAKLSFRLLTNTMENFWVLRRPRASKGWRRHVRRMKARRAYVA